MTIQSNLDTQKYPADFNCRRKTQAPLEISFIASQAAIQRLQHQPHQRLCSSSTFMAAQVEITPQLGVSLNLQAH